MSVRLRVTNGDRLAEDLAGFGRRIEAALAEALTASGEDVRAAAAGGLHRRSGRLAASGFVEDDSPALAIAVGTRLVHGRHLEFGTRRMAAKPWLRPALAAARMAAIAHIRRALEATVKRAQAGRS